MKEFNGYHMQIQEIYFLFLVLESKEAKRKGRKGE